MDAAAHVPREICTVEKAIKLGKIPADSKQLTLYQQLEIMDELFACECTCYSGGSIAYTIYTCFYLHRLKQLNLLEKCPLLFYYLLLTCKSIELIRTIIMQAEMYREEDFYYNNLGITLGAMEIASNFTNGNSTATPTTADAIAAFNKSTADEESESKVDAASSVSLSPTLLHQLLLLVLLFVSILRPYAGLTSVQLLEQFTQQEQLIEQKLKELLDEEATHTGKPARTLDELTASYRNQPATADSTPLHLYTLLRNRFLFRHSWYLFNLYWREPHTILKKILKK